MHKAGVVKIEYGRGGKYTSYFSFYRAEIFLLVAFLIFFTARSSVGLDNFIKSSCLKILGPTTVLLDSPFMLTRNLVANIQNAFFVHDLNKKLIAENAELRKYLVQLEKDSNENIALKELLNFNKSGYTYTSARIFLNSAFSYNSLAILNIGRNANIQENQTVVSGKGVVGRVYKVFDDSSYVILYNDPNSRISVYSSDSREKAIMYGDYNNLPYLEYLKKNHALKEGEVIYTSGDGDVFYPDIPVGIVVKIEGQYVVQPFVSLQRLNFVSVIVKNLL